MDKSMQRAGTAETETNCTIIKCFSHSRFDFLTQYRTMTMTKMRNTKPPNEAPTIRPMLAPESAKKFLIR